MPKKKKKDEAPLKKKQLLKIKVQELEESLRATAEERDGLAAKLATLATGYQELEAKSKDLSALEKEHQELVKQHASTTAKEKQIATNLRELEAKHAELENTSKETAAENELLLLQLHQVQEELEHYFLENKKLRGEFLAAPAEGILQLEGLHFGYAEETGPHRHLDFELEEASIAGQRIGNARLRLVEHNGRAGCVVLTTADGKHPMKYWREDGCEGTRRFLLIVPQDEHGMSYIREAHAQDIILLRTSALLAAAHLANGAPAASNLPASFWRSVALRFVNFLDEANDRLCLGDFVGEAQSTADSFAFKIRPAVFRGRALSSLSGSWQDSSLTLEAPTDGKPPLTAWPHNEEGHFAKTITFSFKREDRLEQTELRNTLTEEDRQFIAAVLTELPSLFRTHPRSSGEVGAASPHPLMIRPNGVHKHASAFIANKKAATANRLFHFRLAPRTRPPSPSHKNP